MKLIAFDTSIVVGLLDSQDIWHAQAVELVNALSKHNLGEVIFDCVLAEAISTLSRRMHEKRRSASLSQIITLLRNEYPDSRITWLYPQVSDKYHEILRLVIETNGMLNFNDALIALACLERKIPFIASFDSDFDQVEWLTRISTAKLPEPL